MALSHPLNNSFKIVLLYCFVCMPWVGTQKRVITILIDDACYSALLVDRRTTGTAMCRIVNELLKRHYGIGNPMGPPLLKSESVTQKPEQPVVPAKPRFSWPVPKPKAVAEEKKPDSYGVL